MTTIALLTICMLPVAAQVNLSDYRWKNRLILLFASDGSASYDQQVAILAADKAGVKERDLIIIDRQSTQDADMRRKYQARAQDFLFVLIGKDGGVKLRSASPVTLDKLYSVIDAMPMRQREMKRSE